MEPDTFWKHAGVRLFSGDSDLRDFILRGAIRFKNNWKIVRVLYGL